MVMGIHATGALGRPSAVGGRQSAVGDGYVAAFSPDGERDVTVDPDGLRVWRTKTGTVLADSGSGRFFTFLPTPRAKAAFTPDGREIVALEVGKRASDRLIAREVYAEAKLVVLDATTLAPVGRPVPLGSVARMISVTPDGRRVVAVTNKPDQRVRVTKALVVDLQTRRVIRSTPASAFDRLDEGPRNNTMAPDGRTR